MARRKGFPRIAGLGGAQNGVGIACPKWSALVLAVHVMPKRNDWARVIFPPCRQRCGPLVGLRNAPLVCCVRERAIRTTLESNVWPHTHDVQICPTIAIDVHRIGTSSAKHRNKWRFGEGKTTLIFQQDGRVFATGRKYVGLLIIVTIKYRNAATHKMFPSAIIDVHRQTICPIDKFYIRKSSSANKTEHTEHDGFNLGFHYRLSRVK